MRGRWLAGCARFVRTHTVLAVSAVAAAATMLAVPPDGAYLGYFDLKTLSCLFGILALVGALRNAGVFEAAARAVVARFSTCRAAVAALVAVTLVLSMVATNDMALIMMLPLSAATLLRAGWERALPFAFIMQSIAANLGGMILPFGNPQNLYLFERFSIPLGDFLAVMAVPFGVSVLLIALCCALLVKPDAPPRAATGAPAPVVIPAGEGAPVVTSTGGNAPVVISTERSERRDPARAEGRSIAGWRRTGSLGSGLRPPLGMTENAARAAAYALLLALVIASVFRLVPYSVALAAVVAALAVLDRRALRTVDFGLLLTFACFFVFAGNLARIPAVEDLLAGLMAQAPLLVSAGASQVISNVPAAVLLSHFSDGWAPLLVGVNIGGAGTLVASLASLITFNQYRIVRSSFPHRPELVRQTARGFLGKFTALNMAFLVVLLVVCSTLAL